ncbi:MAG: hypothetical protein DCC58_09430 [Chloroflexi bacterium]|nr:MAG: hypothetical protein DCC58_09430 [Chloroflexota bacterium]
MPVGNDSRGVENVSSPLLPGGSLIAAALHRQVMIWSDRGGASRHIGDRWAIQCWEALQAADDRCWPVPFASGFRLKRVIRLDDVPQVSREANLQQAENPDFLLLGVRDTDPDQAILQAADAKFAVDRIKPSQVSVDVVERLVEVVASARQLVEATLRDLGLGAPLVVRGVFVCPRSALTDHLLRKARSNRDVQVHHSELVRIDPDPAAMFVDLPMTRLIGPLARIDALPVTPRTNLISAIYYFRLACACMHLWAEGHRPLLSASTAFEPEPGIVSAELTMRANQASSAWSLVQTWAQDVEPQVQARQALANVATLPVRMRDLRAEIERAGKGDHSGLVRAVRRDLDLHFRRRLFELTGEISADDPRPLPRILDDVAKATRSLQPELAALMKSLVTAGTTPSPSERASDELTAE